MILYNVHDGPLMPAVFFVTAIAKRKYQLRSIVKS